MGVGSDETVASRAQMERDHKITQTGSSKTASTANHYATQDYSLLASTRKQTPPSSDTRNMFQRSIDNMFFDTPEDVYEVNWNPIADGTKAHQKE